MNDLRTTIALLIGLTVFMFKHALAIVIVFFTTGSGDNQERRTSNIQNNC